MADAARVDRVGAMIVGVLPNASEHVAGVTTVMDVIPAKRLLGTRSAS